MKTTFFSIHLLCFFPALRQRRIPFPTSSTTTTTTKSTTPMATVLTIQCFGSIHHRLRLSLPTTIASTSATTLSFPTRRTLMPLLLRLVLPAKKTQLPRATTSLRDKITQSCKRIRVPCRFGARGLSIFCSFLLRRSKRNEVRTAVLVPRIGEKC